MTIQVVELSGQRYVIIPEREFLEFQAKAGVETSQTDPKNRKFREVIPLQISGIPASELLMQDRR